jgi:hypothetical protein
MAEGCPARRSSIPRNASKKRLQNAEGQHKPLGDVYNDSAQRSARKIGFFLTARRPHKMIPRFTMRQALSEPDLLGTIASMAAPSTNSEFPFSARARSRPHL